MAFLWEAFVFQLSAEGETLPLGFPVYSQVLQSTGATALEHTFLSASCSLVFLSSALLAPTLAFFNILTTASLHLLPSRLTCCSHSLVSMCPPRTSHHLFLYYFLSISYIFLPAIIWNISPEVYFWFVWWSLLTYISYYLCSKVKSFKHLILHSYATLKYFLPFTTKSPCVLRPTWSSAP